MRRWFHFFCVAVLIFLVTACSTPTPPTELAPPGEIVKKAIVLQLNQRLNPLSQQLKTVNPGLEISQINVKLLESIFIAELPTYHLKGTYNLALTLPRQQINQKKNLFEIYLQRQAEGKTWRLLSQESQLSEADFQWKSYLINN
ncbi:hypothetical protein [Aphanothece sacrum]|uniref:hypothetical protein n=1 Tax=Aphanothece sacrum TaxID=1122 RepID=UPI003F65EB45